MGRNFVEYKFKTQNELFRIHVEETFDDVKKYKLYNIVRNNDSTIENTLKMLETHFKL